MRITSVVEEYQRRKFNKGGFKAPKGDLEHFQMFELGLDLGLDQLTSEELSYCFDALCPCGKEVHDLDSLKKQRQRFRKALKWEL